MNIDYIGLLKLMSGNVVFEFELGGKHLPKKLPRWWYGVTTNGWIDMGYSKVMETAELMTVQEDQGLAIFHLMANRSTFTIPINPLYPYKVYTPQQWGMPGFMHPSGGWEQYMPILPRKECSCGAEKYAELTRSPITGHGTYRQKYQPNPYTGV